MPLLLGSLGNILIPIIVGSPEVGYPRVNNMSLLAVPLSYEVLILSLYNEYSIGMGWTLYPPLSTIFICLSSYGLYSIIYGLLLSGLSSSLTSINIVSTIVNMK
jgi:cytochrome c oxidase subunit 1